MIHTQLDCSMKDLRIWCEMTGAIPELQMNSGSSTAAALVHRSSARINYYTNLPSFSEEFRSDNISPLLMHDLLMLPKTYKYYFTEAYKKNRLSIIEYLTPAARTRFR